MNKKIVYNINLGVIGSHNSGKEKLRKELKSWALEYHRQDKLEEFQILFQNVLFKLKLYFSSSFQELERVTSDVERLDGLILVVNIYNRTFLETPLEEKIDYLKSIRQFENYKVLIAVEQPFAERYRIREQELIQKVKELNFIYCFKLNAPTKKQEILEIFQKIFGDFILRFQYSNPEMYKLAIKFGKTVKKRIAKKLRD